jgi:hypothetical protein
MTKCLLEYYVISSTSAIFGLNPQKLSGERHNFWGAVEGDNLIMNLSGELVINNTI